MEIAALVLSGLALVVSIICWLKKSKVVIENRSDLTLMTQQRIKGIESNVDHMGKVLNNYDLKAKKK